MVTEEAERLAYKIFSDNDLPTTEGEKNKPTKAIRLVAFAIHKAYRAGFVNGEDARAEAIKSLIW